MNKLKTLIIITNNLLNYINHAYLKYILKYWFLSHYFNKLNTLNTFMYFAFQLTIVCIIY